MNWTIIIIETAALVLIFTAAIMIPLIKNPVWWIHDYPKDIQENTREDTDPLLFGQSTGQERVCRDNQFIPDVP